ncbi:response regulator [Egicoccus halophilus]|uniref:Response regulatory domain-containing protein n=1 Tax=Egicoccus halophilus TaxID=1670830 RepID=A0A8J3EUM4_9ACTN|nr:response regulator [Egicoccus halophilus]GGI06184.1 hypothetical protein GCM10011354_17820 [Egicoccus halophilus]
MRLLLVEDDLDLAALLRLVLGQAGFEVSLTDRVEGVVGHARAVEAVVTDGALLDGTADDVLAALAADPVTCSLPVVVCSVRPDAVVHPQVVGRLRKPLDAVHLGVQLRELLADPAGADAPTPATWSTAAAAPDPADATDVHDRPAAPDPPAAPVASASPETAAAPEAVCLRQRGLQELEVRARMIGDAGAAVLCGDLDDQLREQARVAAHRSIGLAGALGELDLAAPGRRAEQLLLEPRALRIADAVLLCQVAAELEDGARSRVETAPERDARGQRAVAGGRVAIVDDDDVLVALVRRRLELAGLEVLAYGHGGEALRELRTGDPMPDVLLLDIDLPGLNGLAVLEGLAAAGALIQLRVVLATVHDNDAELARARAVAADLDHLPKPYDLDRLLELVAARSRS